MTATGRSPPTLTGFSLEADDTPGDGAAVDAGDAVAGGALVGDPPEQATTSSAKRLRIPRSLTRRILGQPSMGPPIAPCHDRLVRRRERRLGDRRDAVVRNGAAADPWGPRRRRHGRDPRPAGPPVGSGRRPVPLICCIGSRPGLGYGYDAEDRATVDVASSRI